MKECSKHDGKIISISETHINIYALFILSSFVLNLSGRHKDVASKMSVSIHNHLINQDGWYLREIINIQVHVSFTLVRNIRKNNVVDLFVYTVVQRCKDNVL